MQTDMCKSDWLKQVYVSKVVVLSECQNVISSFLPHFHYFHSQFNKGSSILDSGTTDIYLPTVVFNEVKRLVMQYLQVGTYINGVCMSTCRVCCNRYV